MSNLFIRTNIAPYRVDTYNAIHSNLNCEMYFMYDYDSSQNFRMDRIMRRCKFKPHILEKTRIFGITFYRKIWELIKQNKPEIVIVPEFKLISLQVLLYKYLFNRKLKVISMCDDSYDMITNGNDFTWKHSLARKIVTPLLDNLLLVDKKVCNWYKKKYHKGLWMPIIRDEKVETPLYKAAKPISDHFVEKYNLRNKKVLLYVGRLVDVKNIPMLIKALALTENSFTTVIVGDGPLMNELKEQAKDINKEIIFPGHFEDDEIRAWFNIGDVFVLPSIKEPFGAVTNEALLGGCFTIISDVCGSTCLIDSHNGIIFNPTDYVSLSKVIDQSMTRLNDKNKTLGDNRMNITFQDGVVEIINKLKIS